MSLVEQRSPTAEEVCIERALIETGFWPANGAPDAMTGADIFPLDDEWKPTDASPVDSANGHKVPGSATSTILADNGSSHSGIDALISQPMAKTFHDVSEPARTLISFTIRHRANSLKREPRDKVPDDLFQFEGVSEGDKALPEEEALIVLDFFAQSIKQGRDPYKYEVAKQYVDDLEELAAPVAFAKLRAWKLGDVS